VRHPRINQADAQADEMTDLRRRLEQVEDAPTRFAPVTTTARPSAAAAGVGAKLYDTTLHKPIWSDGAVWRDAAGTAV
jgi:hypothetical protein